MSREQNLAAQVRTREIIAAREFDRLDEVFASDVVDHDPGVSQGPGVEGVKQLRQAAGLGVMRVSWGPSGGGGAAGLAAGCRGW